MVVIFHYLTARFSFDVDFYVTSVMMFVLLLSFTISLFHSRLMLTSM